jgi:SAM-dependent methyltransferase
VYSSAWFETFAAHVPETTTAGDVAAVQALAPPGEFPRLLDVGCGTGRVACRLAERGYQVTGLDTNVEALTTARELCEGATFVALDQRHIGHLRWTFDVAIVLWNSFGFQWRENDVETLRGLARVLRPGGRLLMDLYHPDWLIANPRSGMVHERGATIDRWVQEGRCFHRIRYRDGSSDAIEFNVYHPDEITGMLSEAGFQVDAGMVWWKAEMSPGPRFPRYQTVSTRLAGQNHHRRPSSTSSTART